jgi:chorismate mutase
MTVCRGLRGATTVRENDAAAILAATSELLQTLIAANGLLEQDVASVFFTATPDLDAVYPAVAARELGWTQTALICVQEMAVPGSLPRCIRVLIHWNTDRGPDQLHHVYLNEARALRPDRVSGVGADTQHAPTVGRIRNSDHRAQS